MDREMDKDKASSAVDFLEGGCLCGAVRYRISGLLADSGAGFCHCRMCQRASGAPMVAFGAFRRSDILITRGQPATYRSSSIATRQFCGTCGSQLLFSYQSSPDEVDVNLATLDHPERIKVSFHVYTQSRVPWLQLADGLPTYVESRRPLPGFTKP